MIEKEPDQDDEEQSVRMFARWSNVFNADQVDGYEINTDFTPSDIAAIGAADALIDASGADIRYGETRAYYSPCNDFVNMPSPERFKATDDSSATENYYSTLFHELTHWTGAKHRLNRLPAVEFSKIDYAFEELVAELGAAIACASTGVESYPRADHEKYISSWLKALQDNKRFIFSASSHAQKAIEYLYSKMD